MNELAQHAAADLEALRAASPLVHNITNYVSMDIAANTLLAVGAPPAMIHAEEEVVDFVEIASALVLNIGTLSPSWVRAMHAARARARTRGIPVVLDPVGAGATPYRTAVAAELLKDGVDVVRGNASEILALAGAAMGPTRGVDSTHGTEEALEAAQVLAREMGCVVAVTGVVDLVTDGARRVLVHGGHPLMAKVTAIGCSATAVIGACAAVVPDRARAAASALACFGVAGHRAGEGSAGPASFRTRFLDALYTLSPEELRREARIEA